MEAHRRHFSDFTTQKYSSLIERAKSSYAFCGYKDTANGKHVIWRHDVDVSPHRSLRLAEIEYSAGVKSTFFLYPRSLYYNLMSYEAHTCFSKVIALGHEIGLHFDPTHYGKGLSRDSLLEAIAFERDLLRREFGVDPTAVSFHLYGVLEEPMPDDDELAGLVNAYSRRLRETYGYVSDSNGVWLHRRLEDVLTEAKEDRLQVLTHPEWWTEGVMAPRARLQRAIDGYAAAMGRWYDETVAKSGRPNLW